MRAQDSTGPQPGNAPGFWRQAIHLLPQPQLLQPGGGGAPNTSAPALVGSTATGLQHDALGALREPGCGEASMAEAAGLVTVHVDFNTAGSRSVSITADFASC